MQPKTKADFAEQVDYNTDFPIYARHHALSEFNFQVVPHWHPDLEFLRVTDGEMTVFVNGHHLQIQAGDGIFINTGRMNYSYKAVNTVAEFTAVIFNMRLFADATLATQEIFMRHFSTTTQDYILLNHEIPWQNDILQKIVTVYESIETNSPFGMLAQIATLTDTIMPYLVPDTSIVDSRLQQTLWDMVMYIHENYSEDLRVDDIALYANTSRTQAFTLFRQMLSISPNDYLNKVRLNNALNALRDTNTSITDIALDSGFSSSSYFVQKFAHEFHTTPAAYRKKYRNQQNSL
ncbi:AraC family transcriptional regulator [Weissella cibaria]|uniref:AraC family transcriptional regulator n=1 Tax=Weissella cibaria TaxID=137591 RepID=UPI00223C368B|nr:AraC family transcriptional regulator [Weissella cibaria]MCT0953392.1 AraC family transcriptional regulator [Weissella cibaria]